MNTCKHECIYACIKAHMHRCMLPETERNFQMTLLPIDPLPDDKILEWSILKQIADDILK